MGVSIFDERIRPIDLRRDLAPIADLIELCFHESLDNEGRDYIRHLRQIARGIGSYIIDASSPENSGFPFHGFVWEENKQIIGNLTLISIRKRDRHTYFIANVAVRPDQRCKGIARKLTDRAIWHAKEHGGRDIFLQVREDNPTAIHIYASQGFEEIARRTSWVFDKVYPYRNAKETDTIVTRRREGDWEQQRDWLQILYPPTISWNFPYRLDRLKPGLKNWLNTFLNGGMSRSWVAWRNAQLLGIATLEQGFSDAEYVWLASSPALEDAAILALMPELHRKVLRPQKILVNYPAKRGREAFRLSGMNDIHTLIWMKKTIGLDST